jgi:ArsR family transcriptional regulator
MVMLFQTLSDSSRLRILSLLHHAGDLCVCDIERVLGFTQTKVSRHLAYLKRSGLVRFRRQGLWKHYMLEESASATGRLLRDILRHALAAEPVIQADRRKLTSTVDSGCCVAQPRRAGRCAELPAGGRKKLRKEKV